MYDYMLMLACSTRTAVFSLPFPTMIQALVRHRAPQMLWYTGAACDISAADQLWEQVSGAFWAFSSSVHGLEAMPTGMLSLAFWQPVVSMVARQMRLQVLWETSRCSQSPIWAIIAGAVLSFAV